MKRVLVLCLSLTLVAAAVFAKDPEARPKAAVGSSYFLPGHFSFLADLGTSLGNYGIDACGGAEYDIGAFKIGTLPFTWGVAARGGYESIPESSYYSYSVSDTGFTAAGLGILHFSWKSLYPKVAILRNLDSYLGLGGGYYYYSRSYASNGSNYTGGSIGSIGVSTFEGNNWFITPNIAINIEGGYYGYYVAGRIGILFML
jgi:hypothetical protein